LLDPRFRRNFRKRLLSLFWYFADGIFESRWDVLDMYERTPIVWE
jgi:hypothetical protein